MRRARIVVVIPWTRQPSPPLPVEHVEDFNIARGWMREGEGERERMGKQ